MNDTPNKNEGAGAAFAVIIAAIAAIVLIWCFMPGFGRIDIAPDNNAVNINGDQRQEIEAMGK